MPEVTEWNDFQQEITKNKILCRECGNCLREHISFSKEGFFRQRTRIALSCKNKEYVFETKNNIEMQKVIDEINLVWNEEE